MSLRLPAHSVPKISSGHDSDDGIARLLLPAVSANALNGRINEGSVVNMRAHCRKTPI
jgi:hypothetical protein